LESVENYSKKTLSYLKPNLFNNPSKKQNPLMSVREREKSTTGIYDNKIL